MNGQKKVGIYSRRENEILMIPQPIHLGLLTLRRRIPLMYVITVLRN